jgi:hypothetical protein
MGVKGQMIMTQKHLLMGERSDDHDTETFLMSERSDDHDTETFVNEGKVR